MDIFQLGLLLSVDDFKKIYFMKKFATSHSSLDPNIHFILMQNFLKIVVSERFFIY